MAGECLHLESAVLGMTFQTFYCFYCILYVRLRGYFAISWRSALSLQRDTHEVRECTTFLCQRVDLLDFAILAQVFLDTLDSEGIEIVNLQDAQLERLL